MHIQTLVLITSRLCLPKKFSRRVFFFSCLTYLSFSRISLIQILEFSITLCWKRKDCWWRRNFLENSVSFLAPEMTNHWLKNLELRKIYLEHWQFSQGCYSQKKYLNSRQGLWPCALPPKWAVWLSDTQITFSILWQLLHWKWQSVYSEWDNMWLLDVV